MMTRPGNSSTRKAQCTTRLSPSWLQNSEVSGYFTRRLSCVLAFLCLIPAWSAHNTAAAQETATPPAASENWASRDFWQTTGGQPVSDGWQFENGEVSLVQPRKGGNIVTAPLPSNFELTWEWKIEKGVNSGLKYRVRRFGKHLFNNSFLGVEYQIIDSKPDSISKSSTAAVYDLAGTVKEKTLHPPGEWNSSRIVAVGNSLEHYLNGQLVAATTTSGPAWDTTIAFSKFYGGKDFGRPGEGDRFMLTDHGGKVTYRNFVFTAKKAPDTADEAAEGPFLANASRNSWADQTSIVIWTRTTQNPEMLTEGRRFVSIPQKEARELSRLKDAEQLLNLQLPDGATLDQMFGACPGAAGRVRLSYFPGKNRNAVKHTDWVTTSAAGDFTAQWKLTNLRANTQYATIIGGTDTFRRTISRRARFVSNGTGKESERIAAVLYNDLPRFYPSR